MVTNISEEILPSSVIIASFSSMPFSPCPSHFYREDGGTVFSKTLVKLYVLEVYKDADINRKQPTILSQFINTLCKIRYNHYITFKSNLKLHILRNFMLKYGNNYRLNGKLFSYSFWSHELLFVA